MTELLVGKTRILIIGDDSTVSRALVAAIMLHESRMSGFEPTMPVAYPVEGVLNSATIEHTIRAMREVRIPTEWHEPEPFMTDGRVRKGKGEKRRLKKQRGW